MDATNIVDVVGEFVTLRKAGVNYKGLCPFHDDKTPSFMVSPSKQICKCFACGEGGTAINFLMKHEQITYPEALRWLAKKYNIEIKERELTDEEKKEQSDRESMFIVNEWALQYFQDVLKNDPDGIAIGKQYFRSRGIRDDIVEKFSLGFALPKRDALALAAQKAGYKAEFLEKTGLCIKGEKGLHDRYAGRVIFPWLNVSGRVVAFGGRLLDARTKGVAAGWWPLGGVCLMLARRAYNRNTSIHPTPRFTIRNVSSTDSIRPRRPLPRKTVSIWWKVIPT